MYKLKQKSEVILENMILASMIGMVAIITIFGAAISARAVTFTVTRTDDRDMSCNSGVDCSLREAIAAANAAPTDDIISFVTGLANITLTEGQIQIANNGTLVVNGNGANIFTINGGAGTNRIFYTNTAIVTISDATLTGGDGGGTLCCAGGAILANFGSLTLERVHITGNSANSGGGVYFRQGFDHRIRNSTISNNSSGSGGGFRNDSATLTLVNSTISDNSGTIGGGFYNSGNVTLRNVTIVNNTATANGGGFYHDTGVLNFGNTIVAGNIATFAQPEILFQGGILTSVGNNLVGDSQSDSDNTFSPITTYQSTDIRDTPPILGALQNNGGRTPTRALLVGSPAIDKGDNTKAVDPFNSSPLTLDQRGLIRIIDAPPMSTPIVDIGAFEFTVPTVASVHVSGRVVTITGEGIGNARIVMTNKSGSTSAAISNSLGYYRFEGIPAGETYLISVSSKHYIFPTYILNIVDEITELYFTAEP